MPFLFSNCLSRSSTPKNNLFSVNKPAFAFLRKAALFILIWLPFNHVLAGEIHADSFEDGSINAGQKEQNGFFWRVGNNTKVTTDNPKSGSHSLRFFFKGKADGGDSSAEQRFFLGGNHPDIWVKYDLFIPSNYAHRDSSGPDNNKAFVWLWAQDYACATREGPKLGGHLWRTSGDNSKIAMYATACENGVQKIQKHWLGSNDAEGSSSNGITANDRGHWMTIVIHAKYATKANNDGVFEMWKTNWNGDTDKLMNIHDGAWYATKPNSNEPARGFDQGYLLGWANSGFNEDTVLYVDNVLFSTSPITADSTADSVAAPNPPTIGN